MLSENCVTLNSKILYILTFSASKLTTYFQCHNDKNKQRACKWNQLELNLAQNDIWRLSKQSKKKEKEGKVFKCNANCRHSLIQCLDNKGNQFSSFLIKQKVTRACKLRNTFILLELMKIKNIQYKRYRIWD